MIWLKILRSLIKTLNSDGKPGQVAFGMVLGALLGLTPLLTLHHVVVVSVAVLTTVSLPAVTLGWLAFVPVAFLVDPLLDRIGAYLLLETTALHGLWTAIANAPVLALTDFNNTVVLGSFVLWAAAAAPLYFLMRWGVSRYRATVYERLKKSRIVKAIRSSKLYDVYRMFQPS